jgi:hypothetical protein
MGVKLWHRRFNVLVSGDYAPRSDCPVSSIYRPRAARIEPVFELRSTLREILSMTPMATRVGGRGRPWVCPCDRLWCTFHSCTGINHRRIFCSLRYGERSLYGFDNRRFRWVTSLADRGGIKISLIVVRFL